MNAQFDDIGSAPRPTSHTTVGDEEDQSDGARGSRAWALVYLAVIASFVLWVCLLILLERFFS